MARVLVDRFLFGEDVRPEQTWELLSWCVARGAQDLTVSRLGLEGRSMPYADRFESEMALFQLPSARRPQLSGSSEKDLIRTTDLWALNGESIAVLQRYFHGGLFTYPTSRWEEGCLEDPTFYREGQIMFGIISHEREGIITLSEAEHADVAALSITTRDRPQWNTSSDGQ